MKAVGYSKSGPIDAPGALVDIELPRPTPTGRDLLVEVRAISVNPADPKMRVLAQPEPGQWSVLGWDAAGVVVETGPEAARFKPGDAVYYAGDLTRPGANAELHLADERIVGRKPASLSWAEAAALPLTTLTAWEALFDRLDVTRPVPGHNALLVIGGAGGVGSMAIQLARALTDLTVIATASRPETRAWATALGAHHVIDHSKPLSAEIAALGATPGFVFSTQSEGHFAEIAELIAPQGRFALIDDPETLDAVPFKRKAASIHWELMFTRSMFQTADMEAQGEILDRVADMIDQGALKTTLSDTLGRINAANLTRAHAMLESRRTVGKIVLEGF